MIVSPSDYKVTQALNGLAMQLRAGVALPKAFQVCAGGVGIRARPSFDRASKCALNGGTFDECLEELTPVLTFAERSALSAGWSGGRVDEVIAAIVARREVLQELKRMIRASMIQPVLTIIVAGLVVPGVPLLLGKISGITYLILASLPIVCLFGFVALVSTVHSVVTNRLNSQPLNAKPAPPGTIDRVMMYTPIVWFTERQRNLAEFCDLLGYMLMAGIRIDLALKQCAKAMPNGIYRMEVERLGKDTKAGHGLVDVMKVSREWPAELTSVLHTAEVSGDLEQSLISQGKYWRELYLLSLRWWGKIVSRALYVIVSGYVIVQIALMARGYVENTVKASNGDFSFLDK